MAYVSERALLELVQFGNMSTDAGSPFILVMAAVAGEAIRLSEQSCAHAPVEGLRHVD